MTTGVEDSGGFHTPAAHNELHLYVSLGIEVALRLVVHRRLVDELVIWRNIPWHEPEDKLGAKVYSNLVCPVLLDVEARVAVLQPALEFSCRHIAPVAQKYEA